MEKYVSIWDGEKVMEKTMEKTQHGARNEERLMEKPWKSLIMLSNKSTLTFRLYHNFTTTLPQSLRHATLYHSLYHKLLPHHGDSTHFTTAFTTGGGS